MISASTAAASSALRSRPEATASRALVTIAFGDSPAPPVARRPFSRRAREPCRSPASSRRSLEKVAQQLDAVVGEDRLGMKLDALGGKLAVADPHHHAIAAGRDLEAVGNTVGDDQRVVAPDGQRAAVGRCRSCARRARSCRSCRAPVDGGSPRRRTPAPAPGGRGRRRASGYRPRGSGARPRARSRPRSACTARARRSRGRAASRAADRRSRGRCGRPRPRPPARRGTAPGCR
jgi:hypothetical protein